MPEKKPPGGCRLSDICRQSRTAGPQPSSRCLKITDGSFLVQKELPAACRRASSAFLETEREGWGGGGH